MAAGLLRCAAVILAAALAGGCGGGDDGPDAPRLSGEWSGALTLTYKGGGGASGALNVDLGQEDDFVSGIATWTPVTGSLAVAGPLDGAAVSLIVHFRCTNGDETSPTVEVTEATLITGTANGDTVAFTGASGTACPDGGVGVEVAGASGSMTRAGNGVPLGTPSAPPPETGDDTTGDEEPL